MQIRAINIWWHTHTRTQNYMRYIWIESGAGYTSGIKLINNIGLDTTLKFIYWLKIVGKF